MQEMRDNRPVSLPEELTKERLEKSMEKVKKGLIDHVDVFPSSQMKKRMKAYKKELKKVNGRNIFRKIRKRSGDRG